ncbi:MAG: hypothetical protein ACOYMA_12965 [Bacteroidia bacterium]
MRRNVILILVVFCTILTTKSQQTILEKSGKMPKWTTQLETGFFVGIGSANTILEAKENAMLNLKAQIVSSVAVNITSSSELRTNDISKASIETQFQTYQDIITSKSGKQDYLMGISQINIKEIYWEKLVDKKTKKTSYQYFIKYPFSSLELSQLVFEFKQKDEELTTDLQNIFEKLNIYKTVEDIEECYANFNSLNQVFTDQRKVKSQIGIDKCASLLNSIVIQNQESSLGTIRYSLNLDNKRITTSRKPTTQSDCAVIEEKKIGKDVCELVYRFNDCADDGNNKIKVSYSFSGSKTDKMFFFDVTEIKANLNLVGKIKMNGGKIAGDSIYNAMCKIDVYSKYPSALTISTISLEWKEVGFICHIPINKTITGKGIHEIEFYLPPLPAFAVSTKKHPENKLNGIIVYGSAKGLQTNRFKIYQADYMTVW